MEKPQVRGKLFEASVWLMAAFYWGRAAVQGFLENEESEYNIIDRDWLYRNGIDPENLATQEHRLASRN